MTVRMNPELREILAAGATKYEKMLALNAALTTSKRIKAKLAAGSPAQETVWTIGALFRDAALIGDIVADGAIVASFGITSDLQTSLAADLSNNLAVVRIEGGGHWIEGTAGLPGSGRDFIFGVAPTAINSIAFGASFRLDLAPTLPAGIPDPAPDPDPPPDPPPDPVPPPDSVPPSVSLEVSATSLTAAGSVTLTATATDNVGVTKVDFYRDGLLIGSATNSPWTYADALTLANNGARTYTARAYDAMGNNTTSASKTVTVNIALPPPDTGPAGQIGAQITTFSIENVGSTSATNIPFTFGQPFVPGQMPAAGAGIALQLADDSTIASQLDVKALHADGSVRHAIISGVIPAMTANEVKTVKIMRRDASADTAPAAVTLASQIAAGLETVVSIVDAGVTYTAKLSLLAATAPLKPWLAGAVAREWLLAGPLKDAGGNEHPLMHVRLHVRAYPNLGRAKVDVVLENTWVIPNPAPSPNTNATLAGNAWLNNSPNNVTYDITITVPGDPGYSKAGILHYNKARWAKTFWWNGAPPAHIKHNVPYLLATKATPNYRQDLSLDAQTVADYLTKLNANNDPMKVGVSVPYMGTTGARVDIAINPSWTVLWLLFGDKIMKDVSIRTSQLTGGWSINYRNKATDNWVSIKEYPYASTMSNISATSGDDFNPVTKLHEKIPGPVAGAVGNQNGISSYHLHNPCYIPYLLTGDFFHLEQLQAWTEFSCGIEYLPEYRSFGNGGVYRDEPRGVAWRLRHLANTAYISPEGDPIKARVAEALDWNFAWFDQYHTNSTDPATGNALGFINNPTFGCNAIQYESWDQPVGGSKAVGVGNYQDDFVTQVMGHAVEQGFTKGLAFFQWKCKFPIGRMASTDFSWQLGTAYSTTVRTTATGPIFTTFTEVWNSMATPAMKAAAPGSQALSDAITAVSKEGPFLPNQMTRYATGDVDYCAQGGAAFAYVADSGLQKGPAVWAQYQARSAKQAFKQPQFAIAPRTV